MDMSIPGRFRWGDQRSGLLFTTRLCLGSAQGPRLKTAGALAPLGKQALPDLTTFLRELSDVGAWTHKLQESGQC